MLSEMEKSFIERHTKEVYEKLKSARVAIAGLGGLGSNIAVSLTRAGVGNLLLIDFDKVDISNLNRQQYFQRNVGQYKTEALAEILKEINPHINIEYKPVEITENNVREIFGEYEIVCEAFDKAENKAMLINSLADKIIISGSGMAGCKSANKIKTRRAMKNLYICGDEVSDVSVDGSLFAPRVAVCANHQALMAIRIILGKEDV